MVEQTQSRWLDLAFFASSAAIVALVFVSIARESKRPLVTEQRLVPALGVVDRCEGCHDPARHPGKLVESHPIERFGCSPCHGGQGLATTATAAHNAAVDWERPLFTTLEREANCGSCHLGTTVPEAPTLTAGRRALAEHGCAGCHEVPGLDQPEVAPDLDGLAKKVKPAWVRAWLSDPMAIDPTHRMPRFDLKPPQIEALTAYVLSLPGPDLGPPAPLGNPDRGKIAVATRRCATCHRIEGRGGTFGPSLDVAAAKIEPAWMFAHLTDTHRLRPSSRMPGFKIPAAEAADIVAYAAEQWVPDTDQTPWKKFEGDVHPELAETGKKLFVALGCRGCHFVTGVPFVRVGMPLTGMGDRRVSDLVRPGTAVADIPTWASKKVVAPRTWDSPDAAPSKMPAFRMTAVEATAIGVAVGSLHGKARPVAYLRTAKGAAAQLPGGATARVVKRYRCLVCHRINGEGGDISRIPLDGAGSRMKRPWLERFLLSPTTLRMNQAERMPVLGLDEADAARLAAWIETMLTDDRIVEVPAPTSDETSKGKQLYADRGCPSCHLAEGKGTMKGPVLDGASERLQFSYLVAMLLRGQEVVPEARHPLGIYPEPEARAIAAYVWSLPAPAVATASAPAVSSSAKSGP